MLCDVGVIRRTLQGDVERYVDPLCAGRLDQAPEVIQRSQFAVYGFVPAFVRTNRPRAARLARLRRNRIVLTFAERLTNRVDRR